MDEDDKERLTTRSGIKGNVRYITITDKVPEHWPELIRIAKSNYQWYAYIYHDSDNTDKHIHLLCYDKGGTTLKSHCLRFSSVVPSNFVLKVYNPRAMARYLIHLDNSEKHQYDRESVVTNSKAKLFGFLKDIDSDVSSEYADFLSVLKGELLVSDFLHKYKVDIQAIPFHHKISLFARLTNLSGVFSMSPDCASVSKPLNKLKERSSHGRTS